MFSVKILQKIPPIEAPAGKPNTIAAKVNRTDEFAAHPSPNQAFFPQNDYILILESLSRGARVFKYGWLVAGGYGWLWIG